MNLVFKRYTKTLTHWNLEFVCIFKCNTKVCCVEYIFHSIVVKYDEAKVIYIYYLAVDLFIAFFVQNKLCVFAKYT